jgi:hypothetical protein
MDRLVRVYQEIKGSVGYFLKLVRLGKEEDLTPEQIIQLINMTDNIHNLEQKYRQLQARVINTELKRSVDIEQIQTLHDDIEAATDKLTWIDTACKRSMKSYQRYVLKYEHWRSISNDSKRIRTTKNLRQWSRIRLANFYLITKCFYNVCSLL